MVSRKVRSRRETPVRRPVIHTLEMISSRLTFGHHYNFYTAGDCDFVFTPKAT